MPRPIALHGLSRITPMEEAENVEPVAKALVTARAKKAAIGAV
jgi:hypothetical protein